MSSRTSSAPPLGFPDVVAGIERRQPTEAERQFFFKRRDVPGYAASDNRFVLNPYSALSAKELRAVALNEAARIHIRTNPDLKPNFDLTKEQRDNLSGADYKNAPPADRLATIAARLLSGDPTGGDPTAAQIKFIEKLRGAMGLGPSRGLLTYPRPRVPGGLLSP